MRYASSHVVDALLVASFLSRHVWADTSGQTRLGRHVWADTGVCPYRRPLGHLRAQWPLIAVYSIKVETGVEMLRNNLEESSTTSAD